MTREQTNDMEHTGEAIYPPKYSAAEMPPPSPVYKGVFSVFIYFAIGYLLLGRIDLLLIIFGVVLLHEAGHFIAMKYYRYADVGVLFLPVIGAFVSGNKQEISQRQSAVILLAGPVPGILAGVILHIIERANPGIILGAIPLSFIVQLLIWVNVANLLPIYPLDGGQLLNRVFLDEEGVLSSTFIFLSSAAIIAVAIVTKFYFVLIIPALTIYRFIASRGNSKLEKELEASGVNLNVSYNNLTDADYWKTRAILIKHSPAMENVQPGPPYHYHSREEKIMQGVEMLLQRNLLMDIPVSGKIAVVLIWLLTMGLPWFFNIDFSLFDYLGGHYK